MRLYRILLRNKGDTAWFFVNDVYDTEQDAWAAVRSHPGWEDRRSRIVMIEVVAFDFLP